MINDCTFGPSFFSFLSYFSEVRGGGKAVNAEYFYSFPSLGLGGGPLFFFFFLFFFFSWYE